MGVVIRSQGSKPHRKCRKFLTDRRAHRKSADMFRRWRTGRRCEAFLLYKMIIIRARSRQSTRELAYLRASMVNGCEYCTPGASASSNRAGITAEQIAALLPFYSAAPC